MEEKEKERCQAQAHEGKEVAPTKKSHGIHMAILLAASAEGVGPSKRPWMMLGSMFIVFVQCMVLLTISQEASHPRCVEHSDCKEGEYCKPTMGSFVYAECGALSKP